MRTLCAANFNVNYKVIYKVKYKVNLAVLEVNYKVETYLGTEAMLLIFHDIQFWF